MEFLIALHRVYVVDWDVAAFRVEIGGTKVHRWVERGFASEAYLKPLPHLRLWRVFQGTAEWAGPTTHLGYGPSVAGDMGSLGCVSYAFKPVLFPHTDFATELTVFILAYTQRG